MPARKGEMTKSIVIIDDDPVLLEDLAEVLRSEGYAVHTAMDGARGLDLILGVCPDLIVSDRSMTPVSGFAVLMTLRTQHPELRSIPFVFLTALSDPRDMQAVADLSPTAYWLKPVDYAELVERISRLIGPGRDSVVA